jgi:hypothetical protein
VAAAPVPAARALLDEDAPLAGPSRLNRLRRKQFKPKRCLPPSRSPSPSGSWSDSSDDSNTSKTLSGSNSEWAPSDSEDMCSLSRKVDQFPCKAYQGKGKGKGKSTLKAVPALPRREGLRSSRGITHPEPRIPGASVNPAAGDSNTLKAKICRFAANLKRAKRRKLVSDHTEAISTGRPISPLRLRQPALVPKRSHMWKTVDHIPRALRMNVVMSLGMYTTPTINDRQVRYRIESGDLHADLVTDLIRNSPDRTITEAINFIKLIYSRHRSLPCPMPL